MKLWEPAEFGMKKFTPEGEIAFGLLMLVGGLTGLYQILYPHTAADKPMGFIIMPCGLLAAGGSIWSGVRKKLKERK